MKDILYSHRCENLHTVMRLAFALLFILTSHWNSEANAADTASAFLGRVSTTLGKSGSLQASFTYAGAMKGSGTITSQGKKFSVVTTSGGSWYNGKDLWSYNPGTSEVTVVNPSSAELQETNPMMYINAGSQFNIAFASSSPAGTKTLNLTPKSKKLGVKSVILVVNAKTMHPVKITVNPSSGKAFIINVSKIVLGKKYGASAFNFPKSKYPRAQIVDLR
ncbi:MAG: outer-membrane lipoprotein carrier protein LolA [Muribaculum sp.]|nr:outer-membrane lipoprotein carrier protein LolA [Muribaculum sp.]